MANDQRSNMDNIKRHATNIFTPLVPLINIIYSVSNMIKI